MAETASGSFRQLGCVDRNAKGQHSRPEPRAIPSPRAVGMTTTGSCLELMEVCSGWPTECAGRKDQWVQRFEVPQLRKVQTERRGGGSASLCCVLQQPVDTATFCCRGWGALRSNVTCRGNVVCTGGLATRTDRTKPTPGGQTHACGALRYQCRGPTRQEMRRARGRHRDSDLSDSIACCISS